MEWVWAWRALLFAVPPHLRYHQHPRQWIDRLGRNERIKYERSGKTGSGDEAALIVFGQWW